MPYTTREQSPNYPSQEEKQQHTTTTPDECCCFRETSTKETAEALLNGLIEIQELLKICLEQYSDSDDESTKDIRIRLLLDSYLSQSEMFLEELCIALERLGLKTRHLKDLLLLKVVKD